MASAMPDDLPTLPARERPSVLYRPRLVLDGNSFSALYGDDLTSGCAGHGGTPAEAMAGLDRVRHQRAPRRAKFPYLHAEHD